MKPWPRTPWADRWSAALLPGLVRHMLPGLVRRTLDGRAPHPRWAPRRMLHVVSADVDAEAGVGAVWLLSRPRSRSARSHHLVLEWYEHRWRPVGGGSGPAEDPGDVEVLHVFGGGGALSLTRALDPPRSVMTAPWIGAVAVHVGPGVHHVLVGDRRVDVPAGRTRFVAAWTAPHSAVRARPTVVAFDRDGNELSRIGPYDPFDTRTRARLDDLP